MRPYCSKDAEFVASSWIKSNKSSPLSYHYPDAIYEIYTRDIILKLLKNGKITIACLPEDESCILGWMCWTELDNKKIIHYIYVKFANRNHQIARKLLNILDIKRTVYCTHLPKIDLLKKIKKKYTIKRLPLNLFI